MSERGLAADDVAAVYEQLLGRTPSDEEIAHQLATMPSVRALLELVLGSEEYAVRSGVPARPPSSGAAPDEPRRVNVYVPELAAWTHPPGARSDDGVAIVGHEGWLFLCSGTNAIVDQFTGEVAMPDDWLDGWQRTMRSRLAELQDAGVASAVLVVPDKLAVLEEHFPSELPRRGLRPVERLQRETDIPVLYPLEELRAAGAEAPVFLRTDTHFSLYGNAVLASAVARELGVVPWRAPADAPVRESLTSGDLGSRFRPQIVEPVVVAGDLGAARITDDNHARVQAVGGHIGIRRTFANDAAADDRTVVVFGDSFAFAGPHYQGICWFLAQMFREVHFVWVPFGWDPDYVRATGASIVLFEGAERFAARVPRERIDALRLEDETLARKQALGFEAAFGP